MASTAIVEVPDTASGVLAAARERRAVADRAEADLLELAVQWAVIHPAESVAEAETYMPRSGLEGVDPVAGPGAPLVAEFSVAEFAAALGVGTEAGKRHLGRPSSSATGSRGSGRGSWTAICRRGRPAGSPSTPSPTT